MWFSIGFLRSILLIVSMTYLAVLIRFAFPCKSPARFNDVQFLNC